MESNLSKENDMLFVGMLSFQLAGALILLMFVGKIKNEVNEYVYTAII